MELIEVKMYVEEMLKMEDTQFVENLFYDESFLTRFREVEEHYIRHLEDIGKERGALKLLPLPKSGSNQVVYITLSARTTGMWQRTIFINEVPQSHREYEELADVLQDNGAEWFQMGLWMEECPCLNPTR